MHTVSGDGSVDNPFDAGLRLFYAAGGNVFYPDSHNASVRPIVILKSGAKCDKSDGSSLDSPCNIVF